MAVQYLYGRKVAVTVGPPGGAGVRIEDLRVAFEITKSIGSESNKGRVQLWNLAAATRGAIKERRDLVQLEAGYEGMVELLHEGDLMRASHARQGPDMVTELETADGAASLRAAQASKSFRRGDRVADVLKAVAKLFTLEQEEEPDEPLKWGPKPKKKRPSRVSLRGLGADLAALETDWGQQGISVVLRRPLSVSGSAKDVMDALGRTYRFDWSVQDGALQVVSHGRALAGEVVSLSPSSGLLGEPSPTEHGVKLTALLIPRLRPGAVLDLDSRALKGKFRVEHATFTGDTHGGQWAVEVEARLLPGLT